MPTKRQTTRQSFAEAFLSLPRELRELVYADVLSTSTPVPLQDAEMNSAGRALLALGQHPRDPGFEEEILEAIYTYGTFSVRFLDDKDYVCLVMRGPRGDMRCSCTIQWLPELQHCRHIRNLVIHSQEAGINPRRSLVTSMGDLESIYSNRHSRRCWEQLLALPRLEQLTIRLQKQNNDQFAWANFTPVLSLLRERSPKLRISLSISFDDLLESYWSDPILENATQPVPVAEPLYDPMGFTDITELIEAPTEEDIAHVEEHLPQDFQTSGQDIRRGLLDETAAQRRALALHYVVKEPALLKVRIKENYALYKKMRAQEVHDDDVQVSQGWGVAHGSQSCWDLV